MAAGDVVLRVDRVSKSFSQHGGEPVLDALSLEVRDGELLALIGPSGCGKSTLLHIVAGLSRPTAGTFWTRPGTRAAYVFQRPRLLPWRNVVRNVEFGLEQLPGRTRGQNRERALSALRLVNLEGHESKYPHQLSGGMQQRAALARGLALDPGLLLLDEPFGSLDALTRGYLQEELLGIVRRTGTTAVLVTHDIDEALLLADRLVVMSSRPGRVKSEIAVPFGEERSMDSVVADPAYGRIRTAVRRLLRPEVGDLDAAV